MQQLSLFTCELGELENKALLVVTLDEEIIDLEQQKKAASESLKCCDESKFVQDLRDQIKDAKERRAKASKELYSLKRAGV